MAETLFRQVRVFDGERMADANSVLVRDGVIEALGRDLRGGPDADVVEGAGGTLLPGLIDAHTHVLGPALRQALLFGVTTELGMGDDPAVIADLRRRLAAGAADLADVRSAGSTATVPGGHGTGFGIPAPTLSAPEEAPAFVAARIAEGSDYIKAHYHDGGVVAELTGRETPVMDQALLAAIAGAAHEHGRLVLAHIGTRKAAVEALEAGVDGLAHVFADQPPDDAVVELAATRGAFVVPTLTMIELLGGGTLDGLHDDDRLRPHLTGMDVAVLEQAGTASGYHLPVDLGVALRAVRALSDRGVPILAGTDALQFLHGVGMHRELELLVRAGLTPAQALAAATSVPARVFGLSDRGRIGVGLRADLLLLDGDPLADITATRAIAGVWRGGVRAHRTPGAATPAPPPPARPSAAPAGPTRAPAVIARRTAEVEVPVLIVGGGPVGLFGALLLARQGVRSLLVERRERLATHPRAHGMNIRSMELLRAVGLEEPVRAAGRTGHHLMVFAESLAGSEYFRIDVRTFDQDPHLSPTDWCSCPQTDLEPLLLTAARTHPETDVRFGCRLVDLEQDDEGVRAVVDDAETRMTVRADYVLAADGWNSTVRRALGIAMGDRVEFGRNLNIHFEADLGDLVRDRELIWLLAVNNRTKGMLVPIGGLRRWQYFPDLSLGDENIDDGAILQLVRDAVGDGTPDLRLLGAQDYVMAAGVADSFRDRRVLLAGDAAHAIPPTGSYGLNTGLQDVHNLAWKLAGVLQGWAGEALLDSYTGERRPVAALTVRRAVDELRALTDLRPPKGGQDDASTVMMGYAYGPGGPAPAERGNGAVEGRRAPHLWLHRDGRRLSSLDLYGDGFTLLAGPDGARFVAGGATSPVPLRVLVLAPGGDLDDEDGRWAEVSGVGDRGALLVRPDGFVAALLAEPHQLGPALERAAGGIWSPALSPSVQA